MDPGVCPQQMFEFGRPDLICSTILKEGNMTTRKHPARPRLGQRKRGFTLTEIAIVLGIMGLVLGAIWVAAAGVYNNQRVNLATTSIMQIAQGVRALYATSATTGYTTTADMTTALITAGAVPNNLVASSSTLTGPFPNGKSAVYSTGDGAGFVISMSAASKANCVTLLTAVGGTGRDPGLYKATAVATADPAAGDSDATAGTPITAAITPASATTTCTNNTNKVVFGFSLK